MFAEHLCQLTCIDTCDARHLFALQPISKAFHSVPMAKVFTIITYNNGFRMDTFAFHKGSQSIRFDSERRHTIIAHQRISERHQLSGIRGVSQALGIPRHSCVENHLSRYRLFVAKRLAVEAAPVVEDKSYISHVS